MADEKTKLAVIDGETLMDMKLPPTKFCVDTLLPQGLCILGGASKIGKSWWVLDLCVRIAKGEPMWDLKTTSGTTLYLCLEDTLRRVQNRLLCITDEVPPNAFFATSVGTLSDGLCEQIRDFVKEHPDTVFVAVDTFQIVRNNGIDTSYANDYEEIRILKRLADELDICLLLVHHLRKQGDSDPFNKLTGTTGIVGAVDTAFVLDKSRRNADSATLYCTGRDVEDRQLELRFSKEEFVWKMLGDSMENREMLLPKEMELLADAVELQPKLYQMIERLATAEELSDHCINIQNIEAEYMEKTVREVVTENRKTAAQMQNLVEQAGKNQEQFILNCSEALSKSTETLDSTIEKLHRKILKIMIATAVSAVALSLLACAVFWKLAV